jgi:hypothetical protein
VEFGSGLWTDQSISGTQLSTNHSLTDLDLWQEHCYADTIIVTVLLFYHRQYAIGQNVLASFHIYISLQYYERAKSIP